MALQDILSQKHPKIANRWFEKILESYPPETAKFLRQDTQSFGNPVGQTMVPAVEKLCRGLIDGDGPKELLPHIDSIVRIRAVQDFTAARAVYFLFQFKEIIRRELGDKLSELADELREFENRIDLAALMAFDVYMECREQVYSLKSKEFQNRTERLLERKFSKESVSRESRE